MMTGNPLPQPGVPRVRHRLEISGLVQGVGFRPFVYRLAREAGLTGFVRNTSQGVELEVEGEPEAVAGFSARLLAETPPLARLEAVRRTELPPQWDEAFVIRESADRGGTEPVIPPDVGLCPDCAREIFDPQDRRYRYPFTNCTNCGPRFTIIRQVPYDRQETTMAAFAMCADCRREYEDPADRRFHAEPTACPACGPRAWVEEGGRVLRGEAVRVAAELLHAGRIVAIKGLGGFHLACDARNPEAVRRLRARKGRRDKPFAVMVRDLAEAGRLAHLDEEAVALLLSPARPIVLAPAREDAGLAPEVAPGHRLVGLLLPYTPLHLLLLAAAPPALVMTSGNLSEEPLVSDNEAARVKLAALADAFLFHDREIEVPCDDSVVRVIPGGVIPIRRARGYVPQPVALPVAAARDILGVGAEQKSTFALAWGDKAIVSQHLGDLDSPETYDFFCRAVHHLTSLTRRRPEVVAHDLHPGYLSSRFARELTGVRLVGVQHHHAHLAACLAEHGLTGPALGLALDGTGFGTDGTVWGGELLVADLASFTRLGHLAQVRLPGGEAAIRRPGRMAAAYAWAAFGERWEEILAKLGLTFEPLERRLLERQLASGWQSPLTSSAGRLLDAVAAAVGICRVRTYEGQPAIALEMAAAAGEEPIYPCPVVASGEKLRLDGPALFRAAIMDFLAGTPAVRVAGRFLSSLGAGLTRMVLQARERTGLGRVALSGGVFQNAFLLQDLKARLEAAGLEVLTHRQTPPNDGCISLGQVAVAAARLKGT